MASKRDLKKDIAYLANDLIATLCIKNSIGGGDVDKVSDMILKAAAFKAEYISRVNHVDAKEDPKAVKAYFKKLCESLFNEYTAMYQEITKL